MYTLIFVMAMQFGAIRVTIPGFADKQACEDHWTKLQIETTMPVDAIQAQYRCERRSQT